MGKRIFKLRHTINAEKSSLDVSIPRAKCMSLCRRFSLSLPDLYSLLKLLTIVIAIVLIQLQIVQ